MDRQQSPRDHDVAELARKLWRERGGAGGSPEDDWYRAEQMLRDESVLTSQPDGSSRYGNTPAAVESYQAGATGETALAQSHSLKEDSQTMAQDTGGQGGQSWHNQQTTGQGGTGVMDTIRETVNKTGVPDMVKNAGEMVNREPMSMPRPEHREGYIARSIEQQTARIPSDAWLWAAVGSIGLSLALELSGKEKTANFVGHWAPTFLIFGLYNKLVKLQGSDGI